MGLEDPLASIILPFRANLADLAALLLLLLAQKRRPTGIPIEPDGNRITRRIPLANMVACTRTTQMPQFLSFSFLSWTVPAFVSFAPSCLGYMFVSFL